ncbi:MAG: hypothetical protein M2R45_00877 [Verrucomicrobia subdivision 3 bacterium]|nr:hypothetical protein [Limisphaerales bacterium]MCS1414545.1 hypothetical protein [Limisphaerales bacterium]
MAEKRKKLLFVGATAVLAVGFWGLMKFGSYWKLQRAIARVKQTEENWRQTSLISLTNLQEVAASIDTMMARGTNVHLLNRRQTAALKRQIQNCLLTYSRGDFDQFVKFRMPCGKGVNTIFNKEELAEYKRRLPTPERVAQVLAENPSGVREEYGDEVADELRHYSLSTPMDIWKYMWMTGKSRRFKESGTKIYCMDCWTGFSPDQSWITVSELPLSAWVLAVSADYAAVNRFKSDTKLAPPKGNNDSTPKMYAVTRLHVKIPSDDPDVPPHPYYVLFALTTRPECWIPLSFVVSYDKMPQYIF